MSEELPYSSDIGFSPQVKRLQEAKGSRQHYRRMEENGGWLTEIHHDAKDFIETRQSAFLATANADGQPYIQHRGGPKGFLRVLDPKTIAFVDFAGNRQYISTGNLKENAKVHLFLMDYALRRRLKIWGTINVVSDEPELLESLMPHGYRARGEQVMVLSVAALDYNCPQHIPQMFDAADVAAALEAREQRIKALEDEIQRLKQI